MKTTLLTVLITLLITVGVDAQRIHFTDTTNRWTVLSDGGGTEYWAKITTFTYRATDTIFLGQTYKRLSSRQDIIEHNPGASPINNSADMFGFREDTALQRIYCFDARDSVEAIVYDANWSIGDSIQSRYMGVSYYIRAIDSTNMAGQWYKVFHFNKDHLGTMQGLDAYSIVEGIGCTSGPGFPLSPRVDYSVGEGGFNLICFQTEATSPTISPTVGYGRAGYGRLYDNTGCAHLTVGVQKGDNLSMSVIPSPATGNAVLQCSETVSRLDVTIYDFTGRIVRQYHAANSNAIKIGSSITMPGMYFFRAKTGGGKEYVGKFVSE